MLGRTRTPTPDNGAALLTGGTVSCAVAIWHPRLAGHRRHLQTTLQTTLQTKADRTTASKSCKISSRFVLRRKQQILPRSAPLQTRERYLGKCPSAGPRRCQRFRPFPPLQGLSHRNTAAEVFQPQSSAAAMLFKTNHHQAPSVC